MKNLPKIYCDMDVCCVILNHTQKRPSVPIKKMNLSKVDK